MKICERYDIVHQEKSEGPYTTFTEVDYMKAFMCNEEND